MAANEKVAELRQNREKSVEREKGLKARLDDAHEELRKAHEEVDALKKKLVQEEARARMEIDRTARRAGDPGHRARRGAARRGGEARRGARLGDGHRGSGPAGRAAPHRLRSTRRRPKGCSDGSRRAATAGERLVGEVNKLRASTRRPWRLSARSSRRSWRRSARRTRRHRAEGARPPQRDPGHGAPSGRGARGRRGAPPARHRRAGGAARRRAGGGRKPATRASCRLATRSSTRASRS